MLVNVSTGRIWYSGIICKYNEGNEVKREVKYFQLNFFVLEISSTQIAYVN